jgi:ATP-binding cassette, subfamily F, member 3
VSTLLSVSGLTKEFGDNVVFSDVSFQLNSHDKLGILGSNGAGKSTLLKTILGELKADGGDISFASDIKIGYLAQYQDTSVSGTIKDIVLSARSDLICMEEKLREMEEKMSELSGSELSRLMDSYHQLSSEFDKKGGLYFRSEAAGVLKGLGFSDADLDKTMDQLSGGQITRVNLGRLLVSHPDLLILDEPINHLDLHSIEWLEGFLINYDGAIILVAHDRYFMNRVADHILDLSIQPPRIYKGGFSDYMKYRRNLVISIQRAYEKQQKEIQHQEDVIKKLQQFNQEKSIKRAESRKKVLSKIDRIENPAQADNEVRLSLTANKRSGNDVLVVEDLEMGFDGNILFSGVNFTIRRGERVAVIGDNGTGKTTILKIINNILSPLSGRVRIGANVTIGYYDQAQQNLTDDNTLFDEVRDAYPDLNDTRVRNVLAAFNFTGDDVYKYIKDLSGGERGRVSLAKLMLSGANFLILDEPTNHLDMDMKDVLEEALNNYDGTVLFVSHDRYFINQTATRILELSGKNFHEYLGNYDYYIMKKAEADSTDNSDNNVNKTDTGKSDYERQKALKGSRRKIENELKDIEASIEKAENEKNKINEEFLDESVQVNSARLNELTSRLSETEENLKKLYDRWEELSESLLEAGDY